MEDELLCRLLQLTNNNTWKISKTILVKLRNKIRDSLDINQRNTKSTSIKTKKKWPIHKI